MLQQLPIYVTLNTCCPPQNLLQYRKYTNFISGCLQGLCQEWLKAGKPAVGLLQYPSVQRQTVLSRLYIPQFAD